MSQPSSSIISTDNAEVKYKKALKEISKLIQANRVLRESGDKTVQETKEKFAQLSLRYEDLVKQYNNVQKEKQSLSHYINEIQKQRNNLERELGYLNDVLAEQNTELKKIHLQKDQRAVATLLRTYEEKEASMNRHRGQNEELITKLKLTIERLQGQVQHQRNLKQKNQQRYQALSLDMDKFKQQNSSLHDQIERLLKQNSQKDSYSMEKQKQIRSLVTQFQKQISVMKNFQEQSSRGSRSEQVEGYQSLLNQKNKLSNELSKIQSAYQEQLLRQKQYFEMEQKMKTARLQWERANEQINMLKSKIIVLEAKQFLEEAGDDDSDQKFFEEKLNILLSQNDPLLYIKNQEDSSHFRILKAFIVDLQDKIYKISSQRKEISRKYKSIKTKFVKNAQELAHYEQQSKLLKGKLQGYERLTQKLQFELERSIAGHEDQITRMTITSNNIISKKIEEYKVTINFLNSQLEINQDKASRTEKNLKQEIQTLRLELDTFKIKFRDETDKSGKDNELIQLYKRKNNQIMNRINVLEEQLVNSNQNLAKFEHLFKEQKGKNEGLLSQKQQLLAQTRQLSQQIDKKATSFNGTFKIKQQQYQFEITKYRTENQRLKNEVEQLSKQVVNYQKDLEDVRRGDQSEVGEIKRLTYRNTELQGKVFEFKKRIRQLEQENETIKIKSKKFQQNYERNIKFEEENIYKNDKINDLTRQKISLENQLKSIQFHLAQESKINEQLKKQLGGIKMRSLQTNHESKRQFQSKLLQNRKTLQSLNQQISDLTTELREQKSKNLRLANELNTVKSQKQRIQETMEQNRKRDIHNETQVGNIKLDLSNAEMQIQRLQSQIRNHHSVSGNLNQQIETLQQKIFSLNQDISNLKMKLQTAEDLKNDLIRDLGSMKINVSSVQTYSNNVRKNINLSWEDQTFHGNVTDIITKIKRICRNYGITIESSPSSSYQSYEQTYTKPAVVETKSKVDGYQDYYKSYAQNQPSLTTFTFKNVSNVDADYSPKYKTSQAYGRTQITNLNVSAPVTNESKVISGNYFDYFKSYAEPNQNEGQVSRNFESSIGTTQSLGLGKTYDSYSPAKPDYNQGVNNSSYSHQQWSKPNYTYKQMQYSYSGTAQ